MFSPVREHDDHERPQRQLVMGTVDALDERLAAVCPERLGVGGVHVH